MRTTEGFVHLAVRNELKRRGWLLIAGQYPGGSDDECCALNILDPVLARDRSPDPRRHSENKLVPDLIALRGRYLLIIEMKPSFSAGDLKKLRTLLGERKPDLLMALERFATERNCRDLLPVKSLRIVPALGFSRKSHFSRERDVCYFLVTSLEKVEVMPPLSICPDGESLDEVAARGRS